MSLRTVDIRQNVLLQREDVLATYASGDYGDGSKYGDVYRKRTIEHLESWGILPLRYDSDRLPALSLLGLHTYLSGAITCDGRRVHSHISSNGRSDLRAYWQRELGLSFLSRSRTAHSQVWVFGENGNAYTRALVALGFHHISEQNAGGRRQSKANTSSRLPPYLEELIAGWDDYTTKSRVLLHKIVRDFVHAYFDTKAVERDYATVTLNLVTQPTQALAREQAGFVVRAWNITRPKAAIDESRVHYRFASNGNGVSAYIDFTPKDVLDMDGYVPFTFRPIVRARYAHELPSPYRTTD
jgi:hypothetical protein